MVAKIGYIDSYHKYLKRLPEKIIKFHDQKLEAAPSISFFRKNVSLYGLAILAGYPLFKTAELKRDYEFLRKNIHNIFPNQWTYENPLTHISLNTIFRMDINGYVYSPGTNKTDYYRRYIEVLRGLNFSEFTLRLRGVYPNGIMLWEPQDNKNEVFNIRKQIEMGLLSQKQQAIRLKEHFYFDSKDDGRPNIPSIIHTTFFRLLPGNTINDTDNILFINKLKEMNEMIRKKKLFAEPLRISKILLMEDYWKGLDKIQFPQEIINYYNTEIIEEKAANK